MIDYSAHRIVHTRLLLLLVWMGFVGNPLRAQEDDAALRQRFLTEAPRTAERLENLSFRAKVTMAQKYQTTSDSYRATLRQRYGDGLQPDDEIFVTVRRGSMTKESGTSRGTEYVMACNARYAFRITRGPDTDRYALTWLEEYGVDPKKDALVADASLQALALPLAAAYPFGMTLAELVGSPDFKLKQVSRSEDHAGLVRITFDYLPGGELKNKRLVDAYMICDPNANWAVTEYQCTKGKSTLHTVIEFGSVVSGFPLAKTVRSTIASDDPDVTIEGTTTIDVTDANDVTDAEFHLSYYGLPEPNFDRPWYGRTWLMWLVGGTVCLAVAYVFRRRRAAA